METRHRRRGRTPAWRAALTATRRTLGSGGIHITRAVRNRVRPWRPAVCVDGDRGEARRLRRSLRRVAGEYVRALGVTPPRLVIVVQHLVVQDDTPLAALLQVFEDTGGRQRQVIFLARSVSGREIEDDELAALLRHQLQYALADALGRLTFTAPLELPRTTPATLVPLAGRERRDDQGPPPDMDVLDPFEFADEPGRGRIAERRTS